MDYNYESEHTKFMREFLAKRIRRCKKSDWLQEVYGGIKIRVKKKTSSLMNLLFR